MHCYTWAIRQMSARSGPASTPLPPLPAPMNGEHGPSSRRTHTVELREVVGEMEGVVTAGVLEAKEAKVVVARVMVAVLRVMEAAVMVLEVVETVMAVVATV